jgi:hypothetical protein
VQSTFVMNQKVDDVSCESMPRPTAAREFRVGAAIGNCHAVTGQSDVILFILAQGQLPHNSCHCQSIRAIARLLSARLQGSRAQVR